VERWLNRDPIGTDGGLNIYGYVEQNPIVYVDNDGLSRMRPRLTPSNNPQRDALHETLRKLRKGPMTREKADAINDIMEQLRRLRPDLPMKCVKYDCPWHTPQSSQTSCPASGHRMEPPVNQCTCKRYGIAW